MRAVLIINRSAAGAGEVVQQTGRLQTWFARGDVVAQTEFTRDEKRAADIARAALRQGVELFIVAGGDGTVSEVARELIGKPATLAILPAGTFNNIARSIGIPPDFKSACAAIVAGRTVGIDVGVANENEYFFEAAGAGLDAALFPIGEDVKGGRWGRVFEAVRLSFRYRRPRFEITADGRTLRRRAFLAVVANGPYYGSGFAVAPAARLRDGCLTVTIYRNFSKLQLARHFWSISGGHCQYSPHIETFQAREVTISARNPLPVHADGRPIGLTPVKLRTLPQALRVMVAKEFGSSKE